MAQLFYLPFDPVFTSRGLPAGGAKVYFFYTETTELAPIYANAAFTVRLENPVSADALGGLPAIYLDATQVYRVRVTDLKGAQLGSDYDPYIPGTARKGDPGPPGPANSTYGSLADLKAADPANGSFILADGTNPPIAFAYVAGDFTGADDEVNVVKLNGVPLTTGALVRQSSADTSFIAQGTGNRLRGTQDKVQELPRAPEDTGGIQAALDAVQTDAGTQYHAPVQLRQLAPYSITASLTMNTVRTSLIGGQLIDASAIPSGSAAITIDSTADSPLGNSYGYKGQVCVKLKGDGPTGGQIGIDFNGSTANGAAQVDGDCIALSGFQTGLRFSNRAYNSTLYRLDASNCDTIISWPAGGTDNGERNTPVSPTMYNSRLAIDLQEPSAAIQVLGGSTDYCEQQFNVDGGLVETTSHHNESDRWNTYAFSVTGNGGSGIVRGGVVLNTSPGMYGYLAYVGSNARMLFDGVRFHNLLMLRPSADTPTCFFNGPGIGEIRNMHALDGSSLPDRFSIQHTGLVDPSYESQGSFWPDLVCITADNPPAAGAPASTDPRHIGNNIVLSRTMSGGRSGGQALKITKTGGAGSLGKAIIMMKRCQPGEKLFSTIHYRNNPDSPVADGSFFNLRWVWGKLDHYDANGIPVWFNLQEVSGVGLYPTSTYKMGVYGKVDVPGVITPAPISGGGGFSSRTAPDWADHVYCEVDMFNTPAGAINFDDGSLDTVG